MKYLIFLRYVIKCKWIDSLGGIWVWTHLMMNYTEILRALRFHYQNVMALDLIKKVNNSRPAQTPSPFPIYMSVVMPYRPQTFTLCWGQALWWLTVLRDSVSLRKPNSVRDKISAQGPEAFWEFSRASSDASMSTPSAIAVFADRQWQIFLRIARIRRTKDHVWITWKNKSVFSITVAVQCNSLSF